MKLQANPNGSSETYSKYVLFKLSSSETYIVQGRNDDALASRTAVRLKELVGTKTSSGLLPDALVHSQRTGGAHPAHTAGGRLEQALRWLDNPGVDDGGLGAQAIAKMTEDARRLAEQLNPQDRNRLLGLW